MAFIVTATRHAIEQHFNLFQREEKLHFLIFSIKWPPFQKMTKPTVSLSNGISTKKGNWNKWCAHMMRVLNAGSSVVLNYAAYNGFGHGNRQFVVRCIQATCRAQTIIITWNQPFVKLKPRNSQIFANRCVINTSIALHCKCWVKEPKISFSSVIHRFTWNIAWWRGENKGNDLQRRCQRN